MKIEKEEIIWYINECPICGDEIRHTFKFDKDTKCTLCMTNEKFSFLLGSKIIKFELTDDDEEIDIIKIETIDGKKYGIYGKELSYNNLLPFDIMEL